MRYSPAAIVVAPIAVGVTGVAGYGSWARMNSTRLPASLAQANGRIDLERFDLATRLADRLAEILVREGDFVTKGTIGGGWTPLN